MPQPAFTTSEVGAGRRLFAGDWRFAAAAATPASLPAMKGFEFAFAGRSNVGKSSLINALTNRNGLARTSNTPGRTQELIFFSADDGLTLVDMPGYGYAAAPKAKVAAWTELIHTYLKGRANLLRVYVLVDARRGLGAGARPVGAEEVLDAAAEPGHVPGQTVLGDRGCNALLEPLGEGDHPRERVLGQDLRQRRPHGGE